MYVLIIADSRGRGLQAILNLLSSIHDITVLFHPGAGSELAVLKSLSHIKVTKPDLVIMLTGICDLTWRNRSSKHIGLRHNSQVANVNHVLQAIRAAHDLLKAQDVLRVSFATITGSDLTDCNYPPPKSMTTDQYMIYCEKKSKLPTLINLS